MIFSEQDRLFLFTSALEARMLGVLAYNWLDLERGPIEYCFNKVFLCNKAMF
jgi:hypothetical protein